MTFDTALSVALDLVYFAVLGVTFMDWLRHRGPVRRAVVLVFTTSALVLVAPIVRLILPPLAAFTSVITIPALISLPVVILWLVSYIRRVPRAVLLAIAGLDVVLTLGVFVLVASGLQARSPTFMAYIFGLLVWFLVLGGAAAVGFGLAARDRAGASRSRLFTAALATALLGLALVVLLAGGLTSQPGSSGAALASVMGRVLALLSAIGYFVAFAPPRGLRRLSQQGILYEYIRQLNALPSGAAVERIWRLTEQTASRASGAMRAAVVMAPTADPLTSGAQRINLTFDSQRWPDARLELDLRANALFLDDDLELVGLLVDLGVRAAEREQFLLEREELIQELQAASNAKSDFLAAMSHELRTPLNAIIGFSELLGEDDEEPLEARTVATYSKHIHESGLHLLELVNDVLDLARVEAGRLDLKPVEFELDDLVRQTVASLQPLADQKHQTVTLTLAPMTVDADPSRVRQVVLNLLSNAIKFTGAGGAIQLALRGDGPDDALLTVTDTGRGISPTDLGLIFEAFQQGDGGIGPAHHEGTGLGLALTKQLVEAHGGSVAVESTVGVGSTFTMRLPIRRPVAVVGVAPPVMLGGRPTVLVIEDDPAAQELLRVHLEGDGYTVLAASTGREGLAWVRQARPDAVLLDILLPDMDGWEILRRLKEDPATRAIPVMVVSVVDDRQLGLALGAIDYFVKPISRDPLLEALARLTFTTKVRTRTVTVLVIDADPDASARYRQLLEPDGFQVISAVNGDSGRRRALDDQPDLIILDTELPDVDGFELTAALRHDPLTATIPVWITTPAALEADAKARLNGNVQGVLARGDEAIAAMHVWLGRAGAAA